MAIKAYVGLMGSDTTYGVVSVITLAAVRRELRYCARQYWSGAWRYGRASYGGSYARSRCRERIKV